MLRLLADQNLHGDIVRALLREIPELDLVRVHDEGLATAEDDAILEWAAVHDRVLITHDRKTIPRFANQRIRLGLTMPGVLLVGADMPIKQAIEQLRLAIECLPADECRNSVKFFPL